MELTAIAARTIKSPNTRKTLRKRDYRTGDIIDLVQEVVKTNVTDTAIFAGQFTPDVKGLKQIFAFVDRHFRYVEDPPRSQWVQTPAYLWQSKKGDCKSFTVFISSILQNIGVDHYIRYVGYGTKQYRHVYPVAILNGKEIPLDVVWKKQENGSFGSEKSYTRKKDFRVEGLYKLGNARHTDEAAIIGELQSTIADIERMKSDIPDLVNAGMGDVTQMSAGELDRLIMADRYRVLAKVTAHGGQAGQYLDAARAMEKGDIAGIGSLKNDAFGLQVEKILAQTAQKTQPAFAPFEVKIPNPVPPGVRGLFKKIGGFIKKVADGIKDLFKKFTNWFFKGIGKRMGPFYIFQFFKKDKVKSAKLKSRMKAQEKSYNFVKNLGKFDDKQLKGLMLNGIIEETGKTPEQLAQEAGAPNIGAFAAVAIKVVQAIASVVEVIKKIAGIFKKKTTDAGQIDESTMSDPAILEEEAALQKQKTESGGGGESGGFNPLLLASLALPFVFK